MTLVLAQAQPAGLSDAAAIAASLDSPTAFAAVFEKHHPAVHRYLARRLGVDLADELAAEAFAVAFAKRERYDAAFEDARPWLFGIATHLARRRERDVLLLHAWEELGYPEIAAALSISLGTVKSRLHRARQRVRQSLAAAGELDPLRPENHE